jgi:hypothetical protein
MNGAIGSDMVYPTMRRTNMGEIRQSLLGFLTDWSLFRLCSISNFGMAVFCISWEFSAQMAFLLTLVVLFSNDMRGGT